MNDMSQYRPINPRESLNFSQYGTQQMLNQRAQTTMPNIETVNRKMRIGGKMNQSVMTPDTREINIRRLQ